VGGLGHSVASAITALATTNVRVVSVGPGAHTPWSLPGGLPEATWINLTSGIPRWVTRYSWLRWRNGQLVFLPDSHIGNAAARELRPLRPRSCYLFTQVALETLKWAHQEGIPAVLDNPNGHIRNFREVYDRESDRWCGKHFHGHPTGAMVERVEEEYKLASHIRVYSEWGKASMIRFGIPASKIQVVRQAINLDRFHPPARSAPAEGPLRICYAGSLDLRKGFAYLFEAIRAVGVKRVHLRILGATGDRDCARLFRTISAGIQMQVAPGDAIPAYQESELLVLPTLEDGLPFVLVEAMACGLPVITTAEAGAAECVRQGESGWIVPAGQVDPLAAAIEDALGKRRDLKAMGMQARRDVEQYAGPARLRELSDWFYSRTTAESAH